MASSVLVLSIPHLMASSTRHIRCAQSKNYLAGLVVQKQYLAIFHSPSTLFNTNSSEFPSLDSLPFFKFLCVPCELVRANAQSSDATTTSRMSKTTVSWVAAKTLLYQSRIASAPTEAGKFCGMITAVLAQCFVTEAVLESTRASLYALSVAVMEVLGPSTAWGGGFMVFHSPCGEQM